MRIRGKVVLITGASRGIGAACAVEFARAGAKLALTARSPVPSPESSVRTLIIRADITQDAARREIVERTLERFGSIDILINNAGSGLYEPSWNASLEEARWLMELNFFAPLALTQLVIPHMRSRRLGMIVNVGSVAGKVPLPWMTLYSASKYALGAFTEGLRMELRREGIGAMIVCPGYVKTGFQENARGGPIPSKVVRSRRFAISAAECAAAIRRGVERDARTVVAPAAAWLLVVAMRLFPSPVESQLARLAQS
jgi:short-subunit dehydrogenase